MTRGLVIVGTVVALTASAGCGGGKAAKQSEASKPALRVLADAKRAATTANSAHFSGTIPWFLALHWFRVGVGKSTTLDLWTARGKGAKGSVRSLGGCYAPCTGVNRFDFVQIGDTTYVRGSDAFYGEALGYSFVGQQRIHGKWLWATKGRFRRQVEWLTSPGGLLGHVIAYHGKLVNDGTTTYKGQDVVAIRGLRDNSKLYVAATGKPYPVAIVGVKKGQTGAITFDDWNKSVSLSAPSDAIDITKLLRRVGLTP
jgi:hypothetical protein